MLGLVMLAYICMVFLSKGKNTLKITLMNKLYGTA